MKLNIHITLIVMTGINLSSLLTGCAIPTKEDIARGTTEFNMVAEKAGNEMLLLNIVRASKRRPMYFTSIGMLRRNMTFEYGTGGITIPFGRIGGGLDGSYSIAPSAGYKNSPLLDVSVLDTKEFTNGIMMLVPMTTVGYYWSLGWPTEILMHLFIRSIDIRDPDDLNNVKTYVNYPGDPQLFDEFQRLIRDYKWDMKQAADGTKIGEVEAKEAKQLKNLIKVQKAGLTLRQGEEEDKMELYSSQTKYVLRGEKNGEIVEIDEKDISLRSPHGMLYYLGELLRVVNRTGQPYVAMVNVSHESNIESPARLFYARKARDEDVNPCVSVEYDGTRYVIPGAPDSDDGYCTDRSMQVLALVSQLIGLQKESEVPATGVVSVVGQ